MVNPTSGTLPPLSSGSHHNHHHRRTFSLPCGNGRFQFRSDNITDTVMDSVAWIVEKFVLVLGPLLICFASAIITGLSWTFFTILLPMIQRKHPNNIWILAGHIAMVLFLLVEICFNYYMCVRTRNKGPNYDRVVRELALATNFDFPETPQAVESFRRDYEMRMTIRVQRRRQREQQEQQQQQQSQQQNDEELGNTDLRIHSSESPSAVIETGEAKLRKSTMTKSSVPMAKQPLPSPQQVRGWMFMAPDEWGYCQRSNQPKPPRSHYDHVTRTLVLCLDHYCPWMFNAIGYFNYRYFCNFLWFVELAMIYGAILSFEPFQNTAGPLYRQQLQQYRQTGQWVRLVPMMVPTTAERLPISLAFMLCLAVGLAVACLGGFHLYLCLTAQTTIEFHGNFGNRRKAHRLNKKWINPYSLGWKRNFQQVFGTMPIWQAILIPSAREPEFLPLPMRGEDGKRSKYQSKLNELENQKGVSV